MIQVTGVKALYRRRKLLCVRRTIKAGVAYEISHQKQHMKYQSRSCTRNIKAEAAQEISKQKQHKKYHRIFLL